MKRTYEQQAAKRKQFLLPTQIGGPIEAKKTIWRKKTTLGLLPTQIGGPIEAAPWLEACESRFDAYCRLRSAAPLKRT